MLGILMIPLPVNLYTGTRSCYWEHWGFKSCIGYTRYGWCSCCTSVDCGPQTQSSWYNPLLLCFSNQTNNSARSASEHNFFTIFILFHHWQVPVYVCFFPLMNVILARSEYVNFTYRISFDSFFGKSNHWKACDRHEIASCSNSTHNTDDT